jgi:seryl-tRNA synthetase
MTESEAIAVAAPESAPPLVGQTCDCAEGTCEDPAVFAYTWDWGQAGACCARHQVELVQRSKSLRRHVQFTVIAPGAAPPVQREERVRLIAEKLTAQEELKEAQMRGAEMLRQNQQLAQQVQVLTARERERDAQLKQARAELGEQRGIADRLAAESAELADEVSRLRVLAAVPPEVDTRPGVGESD